jgi:DNA primase catalytic core
MTDRDTVVDQIKDALDLVDVIQETVELTQTGDEWVGAHPTHESESGRSLNVNRKKQVWQCWNCGAKGDVLDWIADANGLDIKTQFQQVLEIAAQKAGIEIDRGDPEAWSEMQEIRTFYTAAAEYYHSNLLDVHRAVIRDQWGITDDTIDELKIGVSKTTGDALYREMVQVFDHKIVEKSGLVRRTSRGWMDQFLGRIIFPYWYNGQVVYFIGRQSKWTPKNKYEAGKYKKLQTKDDKNEYVSPQVENRYLYGVDSTRGVNDRLVITEGVTDCIAVLNGGMACISPVTTKFRKVDCVRLLKIAKRFDEVFVCNDTDKAGIKGSIQTTEYLTVHGVDAKIARLPVENGNEKMDIAEYLRTHEFGEFTQLFDDAVSVWDMKLTQQKVPTDVMSSARSARSFAVKELVAMEPVERAAFIQNAVARHYQLDEYVVGEIIDALKTIKKKKWDVDSDSFLIFTETTGKDGKKKRKITGFDTNAFARWVLEDSGEFFITIIDTEEVMFYNNGMYHPHGEVVIKKMLESIMEGVKVTRNSANEVIGHVQRLTYVDRDEIDADENITNLENGLLNVSTRRFKPHSPDYYSTTQVGIRYDPEAECPVFDKFLAEILPEPDDRMRIADLFGFCLIRDYHIQKWFMFHGQGANGKGTLLDVLKDFLGHHNVSGVELQRLDDPFLPAELYGKLANIVGDLSSKELYQTGRLKSLSSGTDIVQAQKKYGQPFTFVNHAKLIYAANELPRTKDKTLAFWRRVCLLEFKQTFIGKKEDRSMLKKLTTPEELSGILNYALDGVQRIRDDKSILTTDDHKRVEKLYIRGADSIESFYMDMVIVTTDEYDQIGGNEIYKLYLRYCEDGNTTAKTETRRIFTSQLMTKPGLDYTENLFDDDGKKMRGWRFLKIRDYLSDHIDDTEDDEDFTRLTRFSPSVVETKKNIKTEVEQTIKKKSVLSVSDEELQKLLDIIKSRIFYLGYSKGLEKFTAMQVLMELKGMDVPDGLNTEIIEQLIDENIEMFKFRDKPITKSGGDFLPATSTETS